MNNRGITLVSLIGYIIISLMVISVLIAITSNFRNNFNELNVQTVHDVEFDKINLQISKEILGGSTVNKNTTTENKLVFTNGNTYTYDNNDKSIYLNNNIVIASKITNCKFEITKDNTLKITTAIGEEQRIIEYALE